MFPRALMGQTTSPVLSLQSDSSRLLDGGRTTLHHESWTEQDSQAASCHSREIHPNLINRKEIFGVVWTNRLLQRHLGWLYVKHQHAITQTNWKLPDAMLFCRNCTFYCKTILKILTRFFGQDESFSFLFMTVYFECYKHQLCLGR